MDSIGYINVVLESFGAVFSLLVVAFVTVGAGEPDAPRSSLVRLLVCNAAVLLCDAVSWLFEGSADPLGRTVMELATLGMFVFAYLRLALFTDYIATTLSSRGRRLGEGIVRFMWIACAGAVVTAVVSLFNGMFFRIDDRGMYVRGPLIGLSQWFGVLCILVNGWLLVRGRAAFTRRELAVLGACVALPACALVLQLAFYGISCLNLATTLVAVLLYLGMQMERERAIREQKIELERCRTRLALSQMQPSFLFRALDAIHRLCVEEPPAAKEALKELATYLRANTDALGSTRPVPFALELEHVRAYLALEQRCQGNRLRAEYAVEADDFRVPALSLQFLVERAVERCRAGESACGVVRISSRDEGTAWRASVRGVGSARDCGKAPMQGDEPEASALESMRTRVELLQGGAIEMRDVPEGFSASLVVPKGGQA